MDDEREDDLFDDPEPIDVPEPFEQDGPDLFGAAPDEPVLDDPPSDAVMEALEATRGPAPDPVAMERPDTPLALYRRYRPDTFADIIGQEHVTEPLQRALTNNRVNHAYLFSGPRGCGKTTSARILARALNCAKGPAAVPCGSCPSCRDLARGGPGSIDVIEIDAASHGGVDDARDLRERAFFAPVSSRYKIYIVDEAHMVTTAGFNALLKVVEEPPPHVKFIFATTEPDKVIGTIRSRTHHYPFRLVPPRTLSAYLGSLCEAEGVSVDPGALPLVVRAGAGSVRDSLSVLDQLLGGAGDTGVTYSQAAALLGYTPDALLDEIVDAFAAGDGNGVFAGIDKVIEVGQDPRRFAEDLLRRLRDLIIVAAVPDALTSGLVDVAADQADRLRGQATTIGPGELTRAAEVIAAGLTDMRGTTAPRLHLELMCARVLLPAADAGERGVHARLDRLERRLAMTSPEAHGKPTATAAESPSGQGEGRHPVGRDEPGRGRSAEQRSADQRRVADQGGVEQGSAEGRPTEQRDAEQVAGGTPPRPPGPPAGRPQSTPAAATNKAGTATPASAADAGPTGPQDAPPADVPTDQKDAPPAELPTADASPTADAAPTRPQDAPLAEASHANSPATALAETSTVETVARSAGDGSALTTIDFRSLWPDILAEVKNRRRFTWILLSQNAHVVDVVDGVLSLGMSNPGARDSFGRGGSEDVLREAILQVTATQVRVQVVVEPGQAAEPAAVAPRPEPARAQRPAAAAQARDNIRSTSTTVEPPPVEEQPSREDASVEEEGGNHDELLAKHLGAELIAEED